MKVSDDLAEGKEPLPLQISTGHVLVSSTPAALTAALFKGHTKYIAAVGYRVAREDYRERTIAPQADARTHHLDVRLDLYVRLQCEPSIDEERCGRRAGGGILDAAGVLCERDGI